MQSIISPDKRNPIPFFSLCHMGRHAWKHPSPRHYLGKYRSYFASQILVFLSALLIVYFHSMELAAAATANNTFLAVPQTASSGMLPGTFQVVNGTMGDQVNPHVDCSLAAYTNDTGSTDEIHYFNFATASDATIPTSGLAFLSDVSGSRIAFTNVTGAGSQIAVFDTATSSTTVIPGAAQRTNPSIGQTTVAFEDRSFFPDPNQSEIVLYDVAAGTTSRVTNNDLMDVNPVVSPDGTLVVFQECQTTGFGCDVYQAIQTAPGQWSSTNLTGGNGESTRPSTNGSIIVYTSTRSGETDIYYQTVGGGPETQISLAGDQRNPSISGNLISFESQVGTEFDIFVYDTVTGKLYQVTSTPVDETLNDISVCNGGGRIVYSAPGSNGDFDVFAFNFQPPGSSIGFANFTGKLAITRSIGGFDLKASFTPGAGSNGINPVSEAVTLQIGTYSTTIPAGSFSNNKGAFTFQGTINGVPLQFRINPTGANSYTLQAQGSNPNLSGLSNPVTVTLTISDDTGSAQLVAQFS